MENFVNLINGGNGWLFVPSAILLGALHGLEPGHSKTMMAAFVVAIRGTVRQAVMLGLAATISHTAIVWLVAMLGLTYGQQWNSESTEPYLKLLSAVLIIGVALWVMIRTYCEHRAIIETHHHDHVYDHLHNHPHHHHKELHVPLYDDAHSREHAEQMRKYFSGKPVTTGQIILFGLTGGLIPCPAAITVLLLCLQTKAVSLGAGLVLCFSIGLALTLVGTGILAAWGTRHAKARWPVLENLIAHAPYFSSTVIILIGLYVGWQGFHQLAHY
ncbi:MAG: nickel/cobalt efflux transporter RcnA [Alphaproteobacteria bacterium]|nr:nickel/cobalt efflux transporter RcnA [Alphaproteobacteria bacterium]